MLLESSLRGFVFGNYDNIKLRSNYLHPLRLCNMYFYGIVIDMDDYSSYDRIDIFRNTSCYTRANAYKYINIMQLISLHFTLYPWRLCD